MENLTPPKSGEKIYGQDDKPLTENQQYKADRHEKWLKYQDTKKYDKTVDSRGYQQTDRLLPNSEVYQTIDNWDEIYILQKRFTEGDIYLGTDEGDKALTLNRRIATLGKGDSTSFFDMLKTENFNIECRSTNPLYKTVPKPLMPKLLLSPPELDTSTLMYNDSLGTFTPVEKQYGYLPNFKITWSGTSAKEKATKYSSLEVIRNAWRKLFHDQIRPRSLSPTQAFIMALLTYRCNDCVAEMSYTCKCYLRSAGIYGCLQFIHSHKGIPFAITVADSQCSKLDAYDEMSSMVPTLWYALLELSLRVGGGAIDEAIEATCTYLWSDSCTRVLFGESLGRLKKLKALEDIIASRTNYWNVVINKENQATSYSRIGPIGKYNQKDLSDIVDEHHLSSYMNTDIPMLTNKMGRRLYAAVNQLYVLPMTVRTPIVLALGISARATQQEASMVAETTSYAYVANEWVPISFDYHDADLNYMSDSLYNDLLTIDEDLSKLEYGFIEASTTNSAGLDKNLAEEIRSALLSSLGDTPDVREYLQFINMRIFDTVRTIRDVYTSIDAMSAEWMRDRVSATRGQVGRRARIVQMLGTTFMGPAFIVKVILEAVMEKSPFLTGGKTTNDVRDMHNVLYGTGRDYFVNSLDVVGMDTNTLPPVRRFVTAQILRYLKNLRQYNFPFFVNKVGNVTAPIPIKFRKPVSGGWETWIEDVSALEFMILMDMKTITSRSTIVDSYFGTSPSASNFAFESGSYKTSKQHDIINSKILERAAMLIQEAYAQYFLSMIGGVQGDDHVSFPTTPFASVDLTEVAVTCAAQLKRLFALFSYQVDDGLKYKVGEFLKLVAVAGMPSMLFARLAILTSERGEDYSRNVIGRVKNIVTVLNELSARIPVGQHCVVMARVSAMLLSYATLYVDRHKKAVGGKYLHQKSKGLVALAQERYKNVKLTKRDFSEVISWTKVNGVGESEEAKLYIFPAVWYTVPNIGVAPYPFVHKQHAARNATYLSFPSPATIRRMCNMCEISDFDIDLAQADSHAMLLKVGFDTWRSQQNATIRRFVDNQCYKMSKTTYVAYVETTSRAVPVSTESVFSVDLAFKYGFIQGYDIIKQFAASNVEFTPGTVFRSIMRIGDSYLDPVRSYRSSIAREELIEKYRFKVPLLQSYFRRVSARMTAAATEKTAPLSLDISLIKLFDNLSDTPFLPAKLRDDIVYGDYSIRIQPISPNESTFGVPIYHETGFGSAVEAGSLAALYVEVFGLPPMSGVSHDAIKEAVNKEMLVAGAADDVLKTLGRAFNKGGETVLKKAFDVVGLSGRSRAKVTDLFRRLGTEFTHFPYAINPRLFFYINTNVSNLPPRLYSRGFGPIKDRTLKAIYFSELVMNPDLLSACGSLVPGPSMSYSML